MRAWCYLTVALAQSVGATIQAPDCGVLEDIRAEFELPGLAAFRTRNGETQKEVAGVRKVGNLTKIESEDKFHLGSFTKAMTATLIGMLVDENRMDWDMSLADALPDFTIGEGHRNTTIGMVATHHSGISAEYGEAFLERLYGLTPVEGRNLVIERFLSEDPLATPGVYYYDNTNYIVLGRVLETFAGDEAETWEELITTRLFEPLGMDCGFGTPPQSSETSIDNPWGHTVMRGDGPRIPSGGPLLMRDYPPAFHSTGMVHCDMESYTAFAQLHIDGFNGLPTPLNIHPETFQKLHTPYPSNASYTYGGWVYKEESESPWANGPTLVYTGSNLANYATVILAPNLGEADFQKPGEALAVFTNVGNALMSGENVPADVAVSAALQSMINGTLLP